MIVARIVALRACRLHYAPGQPLIPAGGEFGRVTLPDPAFLPQLRRGLGWTAFKVEEVPAAELAEGERALLASVGEQLRQREAAAAARAETADALAEELREARRRIAALEAERVDPVAVLAAARSADLAELGDAGAALAAAAKGALERRNRPPEVNLTDVFPEGDDHGAVREAVQRAGVPTVEALLSATTSSEDVERLARRAALEPAHVLALVHELRRRRPAEHAAPHGGDGAAAGASPLGGLAAVRGYVDQLAAIGIRTVADLAKAQPADLSRLDRVGPKRAASMIQAARDALGG